MPSAPNPMAGTSTGFVAASPARHDTRGRYPTAGRRVPPPHPPSTWPRRATHGGCCATLPWRPPASPARHTRRCVALPSPPEGTWPALLRLPEGLVPVAHAHAVTQIPFVRLHQVQGCQLPLHIPKPPAFTSLPSNLAGGLQGPARMAPWRAADRKTPSPLARKFACYMVCVLAGPTIGGAAIARAIKASHRSPKQGGPKGLA